MLQYKEITGQEIPELAALYVESFNAPPWNDKWTMETAGKRLELMIGAAGFYGIRAYLEGELCGLILGEKEQFFDGVVFQIKEFCIDHSRKGQGIGSQLLSEFEARLRGQGIRRISLMTSRGERTEGFYSKHGFETYEEMIMMGKELRL